MTQIIRISSNPQGLVSAPIGSFFYRRGEKYFLIDGITENETQLFSVNKATFFRKAHNPDFYARCPIEYVSDIETWVKVDDSRGDKFGWQFVAYRPPTFVGEEVVPPSATPTPTPTTSVMPEPTPTQTPDVTPTPTPTVSSIPVPVENPQFFAIGYTSGSGTNFMKSADGINWASRYIDNQGQLNSVAIGNGTLVALEGGTTSTGSVDPTGSFADIHVSTDFGETWTTHHHADFFPTGGHTWADVVYCGGRFVVLSEQGAVITSDDNGASWTASAEILGQSLHRAAVNGSTIVQLCSGFYSGSDTENNYHVKVSMDGGTTWTMTAASAATSSNTNFDRNWTGISVSSDGFSAVAPNSPDAYMYSNDGLNWLHWTDMTGSNTPVYGFDVANGPSYYIVDGDYTMTNQIVVVGSGSSVVWTIDTSSDWMPMERSGSLPAEGDWRNVTYGNGVYVTVNHNTASGPAAMYSTDGISWSPCNNTNNQTSWIDVKYAKTVKTGKYFLNISNYSTLGAIPPSVNGVGYSYGGTNLSLDNKIYIWKVTGAVDSSGSLICTNVRDLIGTVDTNLATSSIIDITDILERVTFGQNTSVVFTTVGDTNSFTADLMANAILTDEIGPIGERYVRQIPYLTVGNAGYPMMLEAFDDSNYDQGAANFANGIEILDFQTAGGTIKLANGYPPNILYFEHSQDPLVRYSLDLSNYASLGTIPTGSNYLLGNLALYNDEISIWKITGSMSSESLISSNVRELVGNISIHNYPGGASASIDISDIVKAACVNMSDTALVFTTGGENNSKSWDVMTSASAENVTGSVGTVSTRLIPHVNDYDSPLMVKIYDSGSTEIGEVGFAGGVTFSDVYNSFAKIVLNNGYPVPPTYIEFSQNQPTPTPTLTPTPTPTPIPPPVNDSFYNATSLTGMSGSVQGTNVGSTDDPTDPYEISDTYSSVWWKWTPEMMGTSSATVDTVGSEFATALFAYHLISGSAVTQSNLEFITFDVDAVTFAITGSDTYYFVVSSYVNSTGDITLNYSVH